MARQTMETRRTPVFAQAVLALLTVLALAGCATMGGGSGAMGEAIAGTYDLVLSGNGGQYRGWLRLNDAASGALAITSPITVNETPVVVERTGNGYTFTGDYQVEENGCSGTLRLVGTAGEMGGLQGTATLDDACIGEVPLEFTATPR